MNVNIIVLRDYSKVMCNWSFSEITWNFLSIYPIKNN